MYKYSIKLKLAWRRDNNGTDDSLTSCYSAVDDPRRQDKAGLHVNCDDLLGGYDCRCLAGGGRGKQQAFYPSISPSFCSCLHAMIVMLQARQYTHTYQKKQDKTKKAIFFSQGTKSSGSRKATESQPATFQPLASSPGKASEPFYTALPYQAGTSRYSSVLVSVSDERAIDQRCMLSFLESNRG